MIATGVALGHVFARGSAWAPVGGSQIPARLTVDLERAREGLQADRSSGLVIIVTRQGGSNGSERYQVEDQHDSKGRESHLWFSDLEGRPLGATQRVFATRREGSVAGGPPIGQPKRASCANPTPGCEVLHGAKGRPLGALARPVLSSGRCTT